MENTELIEDGLNKGLCTPWAFKMKHANKSELLQMYLDGIDFCMSNDYPSNQYLKDNAGDILNDFNIYIDQEVSLLNKSMSVLLGKSIAKIEVNEYQVSQIFIKHDSVVDIDVKDKSFVIIDIFDNAICNLKASGETKLLVNIYGKAKVNHQAFGNAFIKIRNHNKSYY